MKWRVLAAVLLNAVPVWGVLTQGWSVGTLLVLAVFDFFIASVSMGVHAWRHKRRSDDPGYAQEGKRPTEWFMPSFVFLVFAAAVPVAFIKRYPQHVDLWMPQPEGVLYGAAAIAVIALMLHWSERRTLLHLSLPQMVQKSETLRPAALVLTLSIMGGMFAVGHFHSPYAWLAVAVLIKAVADLRRAATEPEPEPVPPPSVHQRLQALRSRRAEPAPLPDRNRDG